MPSSTDILRWLKSAALNSSTITVDAANDLVFVFDNDGNVVGTANADQVGAASGLPDPGTNNRVLTSDGAGGAVDEANLTFDGTDLRLPDNSEVILGSGDASRIFHDGTDLYIDTKGTGDTILDGGELKLVGPEANLTLDGSLSVFLRYDRGATNQFALQSYRTAGVAKWVIGMTNDSTDNFMFSRDILVSSSMMYFNRTTRYIGFNNATPSGSIHVSSRLAANIAGIFQGVTSQTGDLTQWRDSGGSVLSAVDANGCFEIGTTTSPTGTVAAVATFGDNGGDGIPGAGTSLLQANDDNGTMVIECVDDNDNKAQLVPQKQTITLGAAATTFAATAKLIEVTGDAGANTIATITGAMAYAGSEIILLFVDALVTITDDNTHAANSIDLSASFTSADDTTLHLVHDGTSWFEVSRSVN